VKLPLALAELGLMDEYEFVVQPRLAGHGPTLFAGPSKRIDLMLVSAGVQFGGGGDAVCLITGPVVESTTHLVGHLLHEIESALRAVLRPITQYNAKIAPKADNGFGSIRAA
jgi:hypothetical protein